MKGKYVFTLILVTSCFVVIKNETNAAIRPSTSTKSTLPLYRNGLPINKPLDMLRRPKRYKKHKRSRSSNPSPLLFDTTRSKGFFTNNRIKARSNFEIGENKLVTMVSSSGLKKDFKLIRDTKTSKQVTIQNPKEKIIVEATLDYDNYTGQNVNLDNGIITGTHAGNLDNGNVLVPKISAFKFKHNDKSSSKEKTK